jgi:hypothetical protein
MRLDGLNAFGCDVFADQLAAANDMLNALTLAGQFEDHH